MVDLGAAKKSTRHITMTSCAKYHSKIKVKSQLFLYRIGVLPSVRPKPEFSIGNRNQDQVSVSVSGPELFLPKPKLSPILKSTKNSFQL